MIKSSILKSVPFSVPFGIEIETVTDGRDCEDVQAALRAAGLTGWECKHDGSLYGESCEIVSPVLHNCDDIATVCRIAKQCGNRVNRSCGLHVHLDVAYLASFRTAREEDEPEIVYDIQRFWSRHEALLDELVPPSRRNNPYCSSLEGLSDTQLVETRYLKVNAQAYAEHGTVEFRQHSGTLNPAKIIAWVKFVQAMAIAIAIDSDIVAADYDDLFRAVKLDGTPVETFYKERFAELHPVDAADAAE